MSRVVKGVKKAFKKVTKVVKKVAPVALGVGALVFTGGAALGLAPMAGGWGGAVSSVVGKLGMGSVLSGALTGALTQAGYGALLGGAVSGLTGGNIMKGVQGGALAGAATGGLMGGLGMATDPLAGIGEQATQGVGAAGPQVASEAATAASQAPGIGPMAEGGSGLTAVADKLGTNVASNAATGAAGASTGGGLLGQGGWLERNQLLAGHLVSGLGSSLSASAQVDAERDMRREDWERVQGNYQGVNPGTGFTPMAPGSSNLTPVQRFDPRIYGQHQYQYNPQTGRIERVPVQNG